MPDDNGTTRDGNAIWRIFLNKSQNNMNNYGFSLGFNGGADNDILNWKANTFNINRHDNSVNGSTVLTINRTNGNVGIGTTDPGSYKLYVNGTTYINGTITAPTFSGNFSVTEHTQHILIMFMLAIKMEYQELTR